MFAGKLIAYSIDGTLTTTAAGHLGSTELTNTAGSIARQTYLPYGGIRSNTTNQLSTDRTYTGQTDDGLGWMHYRARQYDPTLGRFLQADTITTDGLNRYTYTRNNPMSLVDPSGRCSQWHGSGGFRECIDDSASLTQSSAGSGFGDAPMSGTTTAGQPGDGVASTPLWGCDCRLVRHFPDTASAVGYAGFEQFRLGLNNLDDRVSRALELCGYGSCPVAELGLLFVRWSTDPNGADPKPLMRELFSERGIDRDENRLINLGSEAYDFYYDVIGNVGWGAAAADYGIPEEVAISLQRFEGTSDPGDDLAVRIGYALYEEHGREIRLGHVNDALVSRADEFLIFEGSVQQQKLVPIG